MTATLPDSLSAVLPAYNEEAVIATTIRRTATALSRTGVASHEVVVVDDGSVDGTRAACDRIARTLGGIRVVGHSSNRGYGAALRSGFGAATGQAIFLMDSDGQFDPGEIERLLPHWDGSTMVCGYRAHRSDPALRGIYNAAFFSLVHARFGSLARDINCGFKLFPAAAGRGLSVDGALISTELLLRGRELGFGVADVEVTHLPRSTGSPTGARPAVVIRAFAELWRMHRADRRSGAAASAPAASPSGPAGG
ncbi:MAG: glycosyltransferase family 2 protein [Candidatus Dormibacteraeota bacterium]|nr:glycosyltransferase family 2 protein [Candidatus Dormibacteraeota bacterium]